VWDAQTGAPLGQQGTVESAAFHPSSTRVVTASGDQTARVWDAKTSGPIGAPLKHGGAVVSALFSPDGARVVTASGDKTARVWDANTGAAIGLPLSHENPVWSAAFSPDATRVLTTGGDQTVRLWDAKSDAPLGSDEAERLTALLVGARLDPELGHLKLISNKERMALWKALGPALATLPDWRFAAEQAFSHDPQTALVSPRMSMTVRQAATSLIGTFNEPTIREAACIDPGHPLLPFAFASLESEKTDTQPGNPIRAAWLIDYGLKRLPADTNAADRRLAARFVTKVAESLTKQKPVAISLLDRTAQLTPEDEKAKALRAKLEK
jgi:hypothetical protein